MQLEFFASSNSSEGFKSYYHEVFARADRLYVIKGGPGTGKSSLMRRAAAAAEKKGFAVEYYFCSSDPSSLDGVLIFGKKETVGMLDGTAPHVFEPTLVGAREEIINLGQFWSSSLLREQKNEILALNNKKSAAYRRAYSYLRSCGNLCAVIDSIMRKAIDEEKLRSAASRIVASLELEDGEWRAIPVVTKAVGMTGKTELSTFKRNAKKLYSVGEFYGVESRFLEEIERKLRSKKISVRLSKDPICPHKTDGIFIEDERIAFVVSKNPTSEISDDEKERFINPKRFIHTEKMREIRGEMRYAARIYKDCLDGAVHALSEARVYHFLLEDIYKNAMDFAALGEYVKGVLKEI